jgi:hypothetical protein
MLFPLILAAFFAFPAGPAHASLSQTAMLDTLQHSAFQYFWNEANPVNGLVKDRSTSTSPASIAATGFGLSALCIGADHGWVTRAQAAQRVWTTLNTFYTGPQSSAASGTIGYKGLFYHFLDMSTAVRTWDSELSTIDTALLFAGVIDSRQYFDSASDPTEFQIRLMADSLVNRADWNFMRNFNQGILMGWKPGTGFGGFGQWVGYNEAMVLYLLALGTPTYKVPTNAWSRWTSGYLWGTYYGQSYITFAPLFGHQYSHCWVDFRYVKDAYGVTQHLTYFENSRRATLAQQAYCVANPGGFAGYGPRLWGLTAGDGPNGYNARGAPPAQNDDGTIAPTAAISSLPFAPDVVWPVINELWDHYRDLLWGPYGWRDGFNLTVNWFDTDVLGIDQGPIILMIENYRNGAVWNRMMASPVIQTGLSRAGFTSFTASVDPRLASPELSLSANPNPWRGETVLSFRVPAAGNARVSLIDVAGREVARPVDGWIGGGAHEVTLRRGDWAAGLYVLRLEAAGRVIASKAVLLP